MSVPINVIVAQMDGRTVCTTNPVFQYSRGMKLRIIDTDLPSMYRVEFANSVTGQSTGQLCTAGIVSVPFQYFVNGSFIYAWIVMTSSEYDVPIKTITIPIAQKAQYIDAEPDPEPASIIDEAIGALNGAVGTATAAAEDARLHERMAADCATLAENAASHYPRINNGYWEVWDVSSGEYVTTGVAAHGSDWQDATSRVSSLNGTPIAGATVLETVGIPLYVSDVSSYAGYGITDTGWYVFARITAPEGVTVTASTTVTGAAGHIATVGADHVDVAVRFEVAAVSAPVTVAWVAGDAETFVFKATDLAIRNLDYRTTFYVYDLAPYVTWTYVLTTDTAFVAGSRYFTESGGVYTEAIEGTDWTAGDAIPADTYYKHSKMHLEGMTRNITYRFDEIVDCASEIVLPVIEDDTHGCWFEFQMRHSGAYSMTLLPPEGVKVATEHTQAESAGLNMIDLHYMDIAGVKLWRFLNTHSTIPTT